MPIVPRPITGKPRHIIGRTRFKPLPAACFTVAPPVPKAKLREPEIARLYNGRRYRNVVVRREGFWCWTPPNAREV